MTGRPGARADGRPGADAQTEAKAEKVDATVGNPDAPAIRVCPACRAENERARRFCGDCGAGLAPAQGFASEAAAAPPRRFRVTRRQMTVLFCDLIGSTELAQQLEPEDLLEVLSAFSELVRRIAARFGGHVARVVGDGVDVYFGYPWAGEDDAVRAVHAGLAIIAQCPSLQDSAGIVVPVQVRVGIATGLVAIGARDALTIAGGVPNLAARIQTHAAPGQVLVSPSTRRIAGAQFAYRDLGHVALKGFGEPIRLSAVVDCVGIGSRSAWRGHDTQFPLIGR